MIEKFCAHISVVNFFIMTHVWVCIRDDVILLFALLLCEPDFVTC